MAIPVALIVKLASSLLSGPLGTFLDAEVKDKELRLKLEAELKTRLIEHLSKEEAMAQAVVLAETASEHWLTRSWRPVLMLSLLGFLGFVGLALPLADLIAGHRLAFDPRWEALPPEFWQFLSVGVGGYVGGRSLEKIAGRLR